MTPFYLCEVEKVDIDFVPGILERQDLKMPGLANFRRLPSRELLAEIDKRCIRPRLVAPVSAITMESLAVDDVDGRLSEP